MNDFISELLDKSIWLLGDEDLPAIGSHEKKFLKAAVGDLKSSLQGMKMKDNPVIAFCGQTNVGKSTLLNTVFGGEIAPVYNGDWSARPVEYQYSEEQMICSADHYPPQKFPFTTKDELSEALRAMSTMENPEQAIGKKKIIVRLNSPVLREGLTICDMPGFLATNGEEETSSQGTHDNDIRKYLANDRKCLRTFIVSDANKPNRSVIKFIQKNFQADHLSVIINYRSSENIEERKEKLEASWREALRRALVFHYINAKKALTENPEERESLIRHLQEYSSAEGRRNIALQDLIRIFSDTGFFLKQFQNIRPVYIFKRQKIETVRRLAKGLNNPEFLNIMGNDWR